MYTTVSDTFWNFAEAKFRAQTVKVFSDDVIEARLVNNVGRLQLILVSRVVARTEDFEWYVTVGGGALMTAAEFVLRRPSHRPKTEIFQNDTSNEVATVLTISKSGAERGAMKSEYDADTLTSLVSRISGTFMRATG
jgi:hypothetical protein